MQFTLRDSRPLHVITFAGAAVCFLATPATARVVVVANRMPDAVEVTAIAADAPPQTVTLPPGASRPLFADDAVQLQIAGVDRAYEAAPDCAYYIGPDATSGQPTLAAIGLGEAADRPWNPPADAANTMRRFAWANAEPMPSADDDQAAASAGVIDVELFVDDEEPRLPNIWEPALRQRIAEASAILTAHGGPHLRIVAVKTWDSDDAVTEFSASLAEFERDAKPAPGHIAIGFTSQFVITPGRNHMGGTRGPLHPHILIKERAARILESERLELLVHELGHFAGASHSPEPDSAMRPVLGEGLQRRVGAQVQFDPVSTLAMSLVGEEIRRRGVRRLANISLETRARLREIYAALEPTMPDDPATGHFLRLIAAANSNPLVEDVRTILAQLTAAASAEQQRLEQSSVGPAERGEQLFEFYIRQTAVAARQVRRENRARAFALAIGCALDDDGMLASIPLGGNFAAQLESTQERQERNAVLGRPTMRGRNDLAKHFVVSVHLAAVAGADVARTAGIAKELRDAQGGSGFSFRDLMADRAGVMFAAAVLNGKLTLEELAEGFNIASYLPELDDLREDLDARVFTADYGGLADPRFLAEVSRIDGRILALPAYQARNSARPAE